MTTTQIRQLAQQMFDFAARADRLGCSNDCALLVNIDDNIAPLYGYWRLRRRPQPVLLSCYKGAVAHVS